MSGRHEQANLDALRVVATPLAAHKDQAISDAAADVLMARGLEEAQSAMVALVVAVEGYGEEMKDAAKRVIADADYATANVRGALLTSLSETTGWARAGIHTASVSNGRPGVHIIDAALIPAEFTRTKTEPDKVAIGKAIRDGADVPGATLRNPAPHLTITVKTEARTAQ